MWALVLQPLSAGLAISELRVRAKDLRPVLIVILAWNIVLRNLVRGYFGLVRIRSIFHAADDPSLERLPFFEQLLGALRICVLKNGNALKVSRPHRRGFPDLSVPVKPSRRFGSFFAQPLLNGLSSFCAKPCVSQARFSRVYFLLLFFF